MGATMYRQDDDELGLPNQGENGGKYHDLPGEKLTAGQSPKKERKSLAIKENFNPFQKAQKDWDDDGSAYTKFRKSRLVTAINGYHQINKHTPLPKFFMPNILLIMNPASAKEKNEFFGLGTEILNPFAPLASLMVYACASIYEDHKAAFAMLMIPTVPVAIVALLLDLVETMLKYVALAIPALIALPIMRSIDNRNTEQLSGLGEDFYARHETLSI